MSVSELKCSLVETVKLFGDVNSCNFNIYNSLALGTSAKSVSVWNWTDEGYKEAPYSPLLYHDYAVISVVFSPDGLIIASSSTDGITYVFNSKTGAVKGTIVQSIGGGVRESAISPPTHRLLGTVTDDGYIFLWDVDTCQIQRYWVGHEACVSCMTFSPDCYLLATGDTDGTFKLWLVDHAVSHLYTADTLCGHVQKDSHDGGMLTITFSPNHYTELVTKDYQMCSGGDDNLLRLWHVCVEANTVQDRKVPQVTVKLLKVFEGHLSSVTCIRYSPDGQYIGSTSLDSSARLWEVSSGVCIRVLGGHKHSVFCCAFTPEKGFFASGSNDKTANLWQLTDSPVPVLQYQANSNSKAEEKSLEGRHFNVKEVLKVEGSINSVDFNNNYDLVIGGSDKMIRAFSLMEPQLKEIGWSPLKSHGYSVVNVEFSRCGRYLVTGSIDGTVIVWNYSNGEMVNKPFQLSSQGGRAARFSPAFDSLALGGNDGKVYLWSITSQSIIFSYPGHVESVNCVAFTPDGEYLATGCTAGQLKLWKASPACSVCQVLLENVHDLGIMSCDFSSCITKKKGTATRIYCLATGGNDSLIKVFKLWPADELIVQAEELFCLRGHGGSITEVRFSSKSSDVLASTAIDRTARIWNVKNGQCLNVLSQHKSQVTCCAFSSDSVLFATGSLDSSVVIWNVPKDISLYNKCGNVETNSKRSGGGSLDLDALSLDDVHISMEDLVTALKRNSTEIPDHMLCPITQQIMVDPVICEDGFTYENHAIQAWMVNGRKTSPMTNVPLSSTIIVPNSALQLEIKQFLLFHYNAEKMSLN